MLLFKVTFKNHKAYPQQVIRSVSNRACASLQRRRAQKNCVQEQTFARKQKDSVIEAKTQFLEQNRQD